MFTSRKEAAEMLAGKLISYCNNNKVVIVAIPRGGVPIGVVIAKKFQAPIEVVLSKKIGHPFNKEFAIGAVTLKSRFLDDNIPGVSKLYIEKETKRIRDLLAQRQKEYHLNKELISFKDKIIILVDDGVATGNTLLSSIKLIELQKPEKIVVALPVAPYSALQKIQNLPFDIEVVCLETPVNFHAVGQFYEEFYQVSDQEVIELMEEAAKTH